MFDSCRNLTYNMTHEIGVRIIQGTYTEEYRFPTEAMLSNEFKVSRNVTREAIKILTAKGLIASRPRKGITVMPTNNWNLFDTDILYWMMTHSKSNQYIPHIQQLRLAIEPEAAVLTSTQKSAEIFCLIAAKSAELMANTYHRQRFISAQIDIHLAILAGCNNPYFMAFQKLIGSAIRLRAELVDLNPSDMHSLAEIYQKLYFYILHQETESVGESYRKIINSF